MNSNYSVSVTM